MISKVTDYISSLMDEIYYSEFYNIEKCSLLIKEQLKKNGRIVFFGQGHSVFVGIDAVNAYDLPCIFLREEEDINNLFSNIHKEDVLIITSNSGINEFVIEFARIAKEKGNKIIVITSYKHTFISKSRHRSNTKLFQYGDIVIDNACVCGDAAINDGEYYIGSYSSIANSSIVHSILRLCR